MARRPPPSIVSLVAAVLLGVVLCARVGSAQDAGDHVYVVAHGDSISTIAQHLGVTTRALAERNHLQPPFALRVGRRLRVPDGVDAAVLRTLPWRDGAGPVNGSSSSSSRSTDRGAVRGSNGASTSSSSSARGHGHGRDWGRPRSPGTVRFVREYNDERLTLNLRRITPHARRRMENFLRFTDGRHHPMNPRLLRQIAIVSDHFGGRTLHVVSGFRPFRRGQYTAHSNHNVGAAMDFRVEGVPNRVLRDFCRTLPQTGCGFYPRSVFVHMDVREESATWVDWSRPGQRPMYGREDRPPPDHPHGVATTHVDPAPEGDESVDEVATEEPHVRTAQPAPEDNDDDNGSSGDSQGGSSGSVGTQ